MMSQQYQIDRAHLYNEGWFETMFQAFDQLHDDVCLGRLNTVSGLDTAELVGWLQDIVYTIQETISEVRSNPGS